jgi:hypothetical protein
MFGSTNRRVSRWVRRGGTVAAMTGIGTVAFTGVALAHHANIQAGVNCSGVVSFTTTSWDPGKTDGENPNIGVYVNVGSPVNWAAPGPAVATGAFTQTQTSFSGTFTVPNFTSSDQIDVGVRADGVWADGDTNHETTDSGLFSVTTNCTPPQTPVTPTEPTWTDPQCQAGGVSTPTYKIPSITGVTYYDSSGNALSAGSHNASVGDTVTITAKPDAGYTFGAEESKTYTHTFTAPDCGQTVTPQPPTATDQTCLPGYAGTTSSGFITIPSQTGVSYAINGTPVSSGKVDEAPGTYTVTAKAQSGYTLSGTTSFTLTIAAAGDCNGHVTPQPPTATDASCAASGGVTSGFITIPDQTGVEYKIDGTTVSAGKHNEAPGTYTVTAVAKPGFVLDGTTTFTLTIHGAGDCTGGHVTAVAPIVTDQSCSAAGTVTAGSITLTPVTGIDYQIDGVAASGTVVEAPGTYTVTATAEAGFTIDGPTSFTVTVHAAANCGNHVTAVAPIVTDQSCSGPGSHTDGSITITAVTGIDYQIDGVPASPGTITEAPGTYTVTATPQAGFTIDGPTSFTVTIHAAGDCVSHVSAIAPVVTSQVCTGPGTHTDGSITLTAVTGIDYQIDGVSVPAGTYTEAPGTYTVTATPEAGYTIDGQTSFTVTVASAGDCSSHVTAVAPSVVAQSCTGPGVHSDGSITLTAVTGISYEINGVPVSAGTITEAPGTYTVTAVAVSGYTIDGPSVFTVTVASAGDCLLTATPVTPTITQAVCNVGVGPTTPTYTVVATTGIEYLLNGTALTPGTYDATPGTTVTLTVQALPGYTLPVGTSTQISLVFTSPAGCTATPSATVVANCKANVVTVANTGVLPVTFTLTPTKGAPVTVTVAPGATAHRSFPVKAGAVTVTAPGLSKVVHAVGHKCPHVLGIHMRRHHHTVVQGTQLPFTGLPTGLLVLLGLLAIAMGGALTVLGARRRPVGQPT